MNHILFDEPVKNIRTRTTLRNYAAIIPEILIAFKKALDKEELPLTETGLRKLFLTACFHVGLLEEMLARGYLPKGNEAKQLREMKRAAKILATYFIAHPVILNDALMLCLKNEKPSPNQDSDEAEEPTEESVEN